MLYSTKRLSFSSDPARLVTCHRIRRSRCSSRGSITRVCETRRVFHPRRICRRSVPGDQSSPTGPRPPCANTIFRRRRQLQVRPCLYEVRRTGRRIRRPIGSCRGDPRYLARNWNLRHGRAVHYCRHLYHALHCSAEIRQFKRTGKVPGWAGQGVASNVE